MVEPARTSLRALLTRQWLIFAGAAAAIVAAGALLLAYLVEDGLIDRQLIDVATQLSAPGGGDVRLPPEVAVYDLRTVPIDLAAKLEGRRKGEVFEMRRANGANVHVVRQGPADGRSFVVTYDATGITVVRSAIGTGLVTALAFTSLFLLAAWFMADRLSRRVARHGERLEAIIRSSDEPAALRRVADDQPIAEFSRLLHLHADLWERERRSVINERQTLGYLAHELRTPLQSAVNSLATIAEGGHDPLAVARLRRAIARLERASAAALWLGSAQPPVRTAAIPLGPLLDELATEFVSLAQVKGQSIERDADAAARTNAPVEVVETVVANLLQNAVQHGAKGTIRIGAADDRVTVSSPADGAAAVGGFGLGLEVVRRLCERLGGSMQVSEADGRFVISVGFTEARP